MSNEPQCRHEKENGERCGVTFGICREPDCGRCWTHCPHREEERVEARARGGEATARRMAGGGITDEDLPPLESPQAAERWLEAVGRAVATGRLGHNEGRTVVRSVREFLRAHEAGTVSDRLDQLTDALAEWRKTGDPKPVLELVDGGS